MSRLAVKALAKEPDAVAPDGTAVRLLNALAGGSFAHFELPAGAVSRAIAHKTVEEIWYFVSGRGKVWRRLGDEESVSRRRSGGLVDDPARRKLPVPRRAASRARLRRRHHAAVAGGRGGVRRDRPAGRPRYADALAPRRWRC